MPDILWLPVALRVRLCLNLLILIGCLNIVFFIRVGLAEFYTGKIYGSLDYVRLLG
jgi:hypothetical protein